jgi:hypothetical protein
MSYEHEQHNHESRLAMLEAKANLLLSRMNINPQEFEANFRRGAMLPPQLRAELLDLLRRNQKVQAVAHCRQVTGLGLKEAKDMVDALETQMF